MINFIESINLNNTNIGYIKSKELLNIDIILPNIQRIKDNDKINDIVKYQIEYYKKYNRFNFLGLINIHYDKQTTTYYLVDGQHRFHAVKILYEKYGHNFNVLIELINVNDKDELKINYDLINKNTPLPEFPESIDKNIPETVALYFKEKYPSIWSKTSRARRPHIFFNYFQEALGVLTEKLQIKSTKNLQNIVETYNTKLVRRNKKQYPECSSINDKMIDKCESLQFYWDYLNR